MESLDEDRPPFEPVEYHSEDTASLDVDESDRAGVRRAAGRESEEGDGSRQAQALERESEPVAAKEPDQGLAAGQESNLAAHSPSADGIETVTRDPSVKMLMEIFPGRIRSVTGLRDPEQDEPPVGTGELPSQGDHESSPNQDTE